MIVPYTHHVRGVNMIDVYTFCDNQPMDSMGERLKKARMESGRFESARRAGQHFYPGTSGSTYMAHENGQNEFGPEEASRYAKAYRKAPGWLLTGRGPEAPDQDEGDWVPPAARLAGYVGAGPDAHYVEAGDLGEVDIPNLSRAVAVEIRGTSLGRYWSGSKVFYDRIEQNNPDNLIGQLCVVQLVDGRKLVKWLQRGSKRKRYHLVSETEPPIFDVQIEWAAPVKSVVPR